MNSKKAKYYLLSFFIITMFPVFCQSKIVEIKMINNATGKNLILNDNIKVPPYIIKKIEDLSINSIIRYQYRIVVNSRLSAEEIGAISEKIILETISYQHVHAISFFFYLTDSDIKGLYTAGKADWAPMGKWEDAGSDQSEDYQSYLLLISAGSLLRNIKAASVSELPLSKKKEIFYQLTALQDRGINNERVKSIICKKYNISSDTYKKILIEGVTNSWPMPPIKK